MTQSRYALIKEFCGSSEFDIGLCHLRASWTTKSELSISLAYDYFNKALIHKSALFPCEVPLVTYLVGEMALKLGQEDIAKNYFTKIKDISNNQPEFELLIEMANNQLSNPHNKKEFYFDKKILFDPISYYNCFILFKSAKKLINIKPKTSLQIYKRIFDICEPSLVRSISSEKPNFVRDISKGDLYEATSEFFSERTRRGGIDENLVNFGYNSIKEMYKLRNTVSKGIKTKKIVKLAKEISSKRFQIFNLNVDNIKIQTFKGDEYFKSRGLYIISTLSPQDNGENILFVHDYFYKYMDILINNEEEKNIIIDQLIRTSIDQYNLENNMSSPFFGKEDNYIKYYDKHYPELKNYIGKLLDYHFG